MSQEYAAVLHSCNTGYGVTLSGGRIVEIKSTR